MHNLVYLIGRLTEDPKVKKYGDDKDYATINLAVQRNYKNEDGIYQTDFIRCVLWNAIATRTCEFCKCGDLVGVRGRLQTRSYEENKETKYITEVVVEKVSFLASKKVADTDEEESDEDDPIVEE